MKTENNSPTFQSSELKASDEPMSIIACNQFTHPSTFELIMGNFGVVQGIALVSGSFLSGRLRLHLVYPSSTNHIFRRNDELISDYDACSTEHLTIHCSALLYMVANIYPRAWSTTSFSSNDICNIRICLDSSKNTEGIKSTFVGRRNHNGNRPVHMGCPGIHQQQALRASKRESRGHRVTE